MLSALAAGTAALALARPGAAAPAGGVAPRAHALFTAAAAQIGVTTAYDAAYMRIPFPGGDVPIDRGVCTDVIVRAYRLAFKFDLQAALNADMRAAFSAYPRRWGLSAPDANIDHRRVPNLQVFFERQRAALPNVVTHYEWQPGDLATQMIPGNRPHIAIISADRNADGTRPLVLHNIGRGTQLEDILDLFPVTGRYRFLPT